MIYCKSLVCTGKCLTEVLLFAKHGENMLCTEIERGIFMYWTCSSMNNLLSYCGLVDAKIRASDKDLPVVRKLGY